MMKAKNYTTKFLQELIVGSIIDDACSANPRFVGRDDLNSEFADVCCDYIEQHLNCEWGAYNNRYLNDATPRQQRESAKWAPVIKAMIYERLRVRLS